jgi:hypothetical protein
MAVVAEAAAKITRALKGNHDPAAKTPEVVRRPVGLRCRSAVVRRRRLFPSSDGGAKPARFERHYSIQAMLFPAEDAEAAYRKAVEEADIDSDANFDPPAHRTVYYSLGLHQLEEYPGAENFSADLHSRGVWIARFDPQDVDVNGVPRVRVKAELDVFRP